MKKSVVSLVTVATLAGLGLTATVNAAGYPPAPAVGELGAVIVNPYDNAPLTAVILRDGAELSDVHVTVQGKGHKGVDIEYDVGKTSILTHDGIPVWGMYANHENKVTIEFTKDGKKFEENYKILTGSLTNHYIDNRSQSIMQPVDVKKVDKQFKDRLYLVNSSTNTFHGSDMHWSGQKPQNAHPLDPSPATGSASFEAAPMTYMIDTQGEYRWWLNQDATYEGYDRNMDSRGYLMGLSETKDGTFVFVQGQSWGEVDMLGRVITFKRLPGGYVDGSHEARYTANDTILIRAGKANYKREDGQHVHTVRDQVIEIDRQGNLIEAWDFNKILDPLRDDLLGALDQGAVCLNVDLNHVGETAELEPDTPFGDALGVGPGRNWAHINSIEYDPKDDAIIVSLRHQGVVKVGRDMEVKWIQAPDVGWGELSDKVLTPVDNEGNKLNCKGATCEGTDFDWTYTQHTAWLSPKGTLTVFDNGDGRNLEQPAMPTMKYSRFVEYKIDEDKGTIEQIWEYGKEKGYDWYSPVTSITEYRADRNTMFNFSGSIDLFKPGPTPTVGKLTEIDYDSKEIMVEIDVRTDKPHKPHYRALIINPNSVFAK
ncbi:aryl-sulfate sulfotransferase [Ferrimonas lipolytica]|uniref:Aryl-sulfate sulfotransferase n=1 Tax=Ferrimonas lipolytica TaxID=2724191 RepID=A0A6H1UK03_9GAMM|nr:aryl-sulfate sulfotransferase [Ferrimonas lipolytica]QIZ78132.1 aryl-sulfate sulfotransferase [Ferrimonas lipolytica]